MIDTQNLCTASLYINNQLVSRGLLRDGQSIDFAQTGAGAGDSAATAGRIISIVNDLILRRDRDAEQRESLSVAMRSLRAENIKQAGEIARLTDRHAEEKRRAAIASAGESALRTQLKSAEAAARGQKEEIARCKALVVQTRSACATEVRRRDRQIETLKKQLAEAGRARGSKASPSVTTIHVTADVGADKTSPAPKGSPGSRGGGGGGDCSLRDETNAFLAKLAQDLSEENETMLGVMQHTMGQLREMSACPEAERSDAEVAKRPGCEELVAELAAVTDHMRNILTNPSFVPIEEVVLRDEEIGRLRAGWVKMESRWKEAVRMIDGRRKRMATSGKPVCDEELKMGLRLSPVRVKDVAETRAALATGLEAVEEDEEEDEEAEEADEHDDGAHHSPCPPSHCRVEPVPHEVESDAASVDFENNITILDDSEPDGDDAAARPGFSPASSPLPEPPQLSPLRNSASAGNRGGTTADKPLRPRLGDFSTIVEERTQELAAESPSARALPLRPKGPAATEAPLPRLPSRGFEPPPPQRARSPSHTSLDEVLLARPRPAPAAAVDPAGEDGRGRPRSGTRERKARRDGAPGRDQEDPVPARSSITEDDDDDARHRMSDRPPAAPKHAARNNSPPHAEASIAAKLAASEREADAARVRAKLRAARSSRGGGVVARPTSTSGPPPHAAAAALEDVDPVKHDLAPPQPPPPPPHQQLPPPTRPVERRKRDRVTVRTASRRRSTLSPWELQALISGGGAE